MRALRHASRQRPGLWSIRERLGKFAAIFWTIAAWLHGKFIVRV